MSHSDIRLTGIGQIAVSVSDLARAVEFYRDRLRIPFLFEVPGMAFLDCGGVRLMLTLAEKSPESYSSILYFRVEDIRSAYDGLAGRGVPFEGEPRLIARMPDHELWMAFFRDPDRNLHALMSEVRKESAVSVDSQTGLAQNG